MRTLIICTVLVLTAAGCGTAATSPSGSTGAARTDATTPPTTPPTTPAPAPPAAPTRALLRHPTPRPPGVIRQFDYVGGAGPGACVEGPGPARVQVFAQPFSTMPIRPGNERLHNDRVTFGQPVDVCFNGFGNGPVVVTVDEAGHRTVRGVFPYMPPRDGAVGGAWYDWVPAIDASWPLGRYTITARSKTLSASASVRVVSPTEPGLRVLGPSTDPGHNEVSSHSTAKIFLVGFRAGAQVRLVIYRWKGVAGRATYFSSAVVPIGAGGSTIAELATGAPSGLTTYVAVVRAGAYTLSGAFNIVRMQPNPEQAVGALPGG